MAEPFVGPPTPGTGGVMQPQANAALATYDQAYQTADSAVVDAQQNLADAVKGYNDLGPPPALALDGTATAQGANYNTQLRAFEARIQNAQTAINSALADRQRAADTRAKAYADAATRADPQTQSKAQADASKAQTDAARADGEYKEWQGTAEDRKAEVAAKQRTASALAAKQELDNAYQAETDPTRKALLKTQLDTANANLTTAQADAGVAGQVAQLRVQQGQANVAQTGAQTGLVGAQANEANATANRTNTLLPGEVTRQGADVAGVNATTAQTQANVDKAKLGTLYGLDDKIKQIKQDFADGKLSSLPDPQQFVNDFITAATSGSTPYDIFKDQQTQETQRLGQQVSQRDVESRLLGQKANAYSQMGSNALTTFAGMNDYAPVGSDLGGKAYLSMLNQFKTDLGGQGGFKLPPAVPIPDAPSYLNKYQGPPGAPAPAPGGAPPAPAPMPAPAPSPEAGSGHTINITIGGSGGGGGGYETGVLGNGSAPIPAYASGTNYAQGGPSLVGEQGPEVVDLPQGSQVQPAYLSNQQQPQPFNLVDHVHALYPEQSARYRQRQAAGMG